MIRIYHEAHIKQFRQEPETFHSRRRVLPMMSSRRWIFVVRSHFRHFRIFDIQISANWLVTLLRYRTQTVPDGAYDKSQERRWMTSDYLISDTRNEFNAPINFLTVKFPLDNEFIVDDYFNRFVDSRNSFDQFLSSCYRSCPVSLVEKLNSCSLRWQISRSRSCY